MRKVFVNCGGEKVVKAGLNPPRFAVIGRHYMLTHRWAEDTVVLPNVGESTVYRCIARERCGKPGTPGVLGWFSTRPEAVRALREADPVEWGDLAVEEARDMPGHQ